MFNPGRSQQPQSQPKTEGAAKKFKGFGSQTFEEPTTGEKINAVCVERVFDEIPDFKTGIPKTKLILVFELDELKADGTPFFRELKMHPGFTKSGRGGCDKHFRSWAGSKDPLNQAQQDEWTAAINGASDFENDYIDPNPPIVGAQCQVVLEYNEQGTFVNIEKIYPPTDQQMANPLKKSDKYVPYFERKKAREQKEREEGGKSGGSGPRHSPTGSRPTAPRQVSIDEDEIPF